MAFQFLCPQNHLLQGDESQAGQQCKCPYCGTVFIVPQPAAPVGPDPSVQVQPGAGFTQTGYEQQPAFQQPAYQQPAYQEPEQPVYQEPAAEQFPGVQAAPDFGQGAAPTAPDEPPPEFGTPSASQQDILHIPCPAGHELETPRDMLGQDALCPFCQTQFQLRLEDSVEYRKEQEEAQIRREMQLGKSWMYWSIGIAVAVVMGVIVLIVIAAG